MGGSDLFDWICFTIAMGGLIGWQLTGNAVLGVWLASLADFVAYLPAYVKTWRHPNSESPWLYILNIGGSLLSLAAYKLAAISVFQFTIMTTSVLMVLCIYHKNLLDGSQRHNG
ncbi:MAG TPA: hypothetical protein VIJ68_03125 [Candidatus Saccharimonadales bacterium]